MNKAVISHLTPPPGHRLLVMSDIHGDLTLLRRLLASAHLSPDDLLVLLGDLLEKGPESLATLRFVMELSRTHQVFPVNGNCDDLVVGFVDGREELPDAFFRYYLGLYRNRSTLVQMGLEAGLSDIEMEDFPHFRAVLRERFQPELDFLRGFPTVIDTPKLLFVHGGVPSDRNMESLDAWQCMKNDHFALQDFSLSKLCVVGHTPTTMYNPFIPCSNPFFQREKGLLSIDGGRSVKIDGQLNLVIFPDAYSTEFTSLYADGLPTVTAVEGQEPSPQSINLRWSHNRLQLLEQGPEFSRCLHKESGQTVEILTEYLYTDTKGVLRCEDSTDYLLPVARGDTLSVVRHTSRGLLAKRGGVTGWYRGQFLAPL